MVMCILKAVFWVAALRKMEQFPSGPDTAPYPLISWLCIENPHGLLLLAPIQHFSPQDGGSLFLPNVGIQQQPRRPSSTTSIIFFSSTLNR